ncbi:hypothetical protein NEOLI_005387 [Neolecta irregularis DAH-3]|uniref:Uncharacterized protein n=1 Tax=Neolecta irregularis (strain DAH-3) TaxID=1198029 RepID=A0A1U7LGW5_NEOID|nr:hypothetical protein NEOLI_005387 [Neolecta irregularis DAH-3]|eukprot:OLL21900.1 hypothetical protein NEOLI_005387 [Neolecta irregularis DAH-3]
MKLDDDTFLNIPALLDVIRPQYPREGAYIGRAIGLDDPEGKFFMGGCGYILSWDYVVYIGHNNSLQRDGREDWLTADWIRGSGINTTNFLDLGFRVTDHPDSKLGWRADFAKDTIMVHQLKTAQLWAKTWNYFALNVFAGT